MPGPQLQQPNPAAAAQQVPGGPQTAAPPAQPQGQMPVSPLRQQGQADPPQPVRDARGAANAAREHSNRQGAGATDANPKEQAEYERALKAIDEIIYGDDAANEAIMRGILPEDKIGSVAQTSALLIKQIDEKIDMDEVIIADMTMEITDRVIDIAENGRGLQFSEGELQAILGSVWELVMGSYGVDPNDYAEMTQGMSDDDISGAETQYNEFLAGAG